MILAFRAVGGIFGTVQGPLDTPIEFLKGVGPQRGELLKKELGIATIGGLLLHYPFRYVDRSVIHTVKDITEAMPRLKYENTAANYVEARLSLDAREARLIDGL